MSRANYPQIDGMANMWTSLKKSKLLKGATSRQPGPNSTATSLAAGNQQTNLPAELCKRCNQLRLKDLLPSRHIRFLSMAPDEIDFNPRKVSLTTTCPFCRLLAHSLGGPALITGLRIEHLGDTQTLEGKTTQSVCVRACVGSNMGNRIAPCGEDAFRISSQKYSYARRLNPDLADRSLMKSWLSQSVSGEQVLPNASSTCFIDIQNMCVVVPVESTTCHYFALSYVWGNTQSLQLLQDNKELLQSPGYLRANYERLAPVIQDAIKITQELGQDYLWVDSLCITQDDVENKHTQISNMNDIYKHAAATLVAVRGNDSSSGLPGVRPYKRPRSQHVERVHHMQLAVLLPDLADVQSQYFERAWTYQEERLSQNLLYFTEDQVYFSSVRSIFCEDRYEDDPDVPYLRGGQLLGSPYPYTEFDWWKKSIVEYSTRICSYPDDRYNAFQGIAMELEQRWQYPCLRGLPLQHLIASLFWSHELSGTAERIVSHPSWSWCGWTGAVRFPYPSVQGAISAVEATEGNIVYRWSWSEFKEVVSSRTVITAGADDSALIPSGEDSSVSTTDSLTLRESSPERQFMPSMVHQQISAPLVLRFVALSVLVELKMIEVYSESIVYGINSKRGKLDGKITLRIRNERPPRNKRRPGVLLAECLLLATDNTVISITHQSTQGRSNDIYGVGLEKNEQATNVYVLLVEYRGDGVCERKGVGEVNLHSIVAWHPVLREVQLG